MADVTKNLKAYLQSSAALSRLVANRVHENNVPSLEDTKLDYVWVRLAGRQYEHCLDDAAGIPPRSMLFDCECCSRVLQRSNEIADAVRNLFPYSGAFGSDTVKGAFVNDQDEDYIPINENAGTGVHVQALQLEICP